VVFSSGADVCQVIPPCSIMSSGLNCFRPDFKVTRLYARAKGIVQVVRDASVFNK
jgi:hypothetical protein